jgi:uncharacterized lipoprotein
MLFIKKTKSIITALRSLAIISLSTMALSGCSGPTHLIVSPDIVSISSIKYQPTEVNFNVTDKRSNSHLLQILREGKAAELLSTNIALDNIITKALAPQFKNQGLIITAANTDKEIDVIIDEALISVDQTALSFKSENKLEIRFIVKNKDKTLTKTFTSKGKSNGAFKADIAVLETDYTQQLTELLTKALANTEIQAVLK